MLVVWLTPPPSRSDPPRPAGLVRVAPLSIQDVEELYATRIVNEALGVRLAVPTMTAEDDAVLKQSLRDMARFAAERDVDPWEQHHAVFHARLVSGCGTRLGALLSDLYDHAERYRRLYVIGDPRAMSIAAAEHDAIVEACRARNAGRAAAELARHLSRTALMALAQIAPEHEPAMVRSALRAVLGGEEIGASVEEVQGATS